METLLNCHFASCGDLIGLRRRYCIAFRRVPSPSINIKCWCTHFGYDWSHICVLYLHSTLDMTLHVVSLFDIDLIVHALIYDMLSRGGHMDDITLHVMLGTIRDCRLLSIDMDTYIICHHVCYSYLCYAWMWITWHFGKVSEYVRNLWYYLNIWL